MTGGSSGVSTALCCKALVKFPDLLITDVTERDPRHPPHLGKWDMLLLGVPHASGMGLWAVDEGTRMSPDEQTKCLFGTEPWKMTGHNGQRDMFN